MTGSSRTLIDRLTAENFDVTQLRLLTNDFALEMGWRPSSNFNVDRLSGECNAHLLVEHGLVDAAMLTFMKGNAPSSYDSKSLLLISYNNLTDWHIQIYSDKIHVYFNRTNPPTLIDTLNVSGDDVDRIHRKNFDIITEKRPTPNLQSLDIALIGSISAGKATIYSSLQSKDVDVGNENISALYNALITLRAAEDYKNSLINPDTRIIENSFLHYWQTNTSKAFSTIIDEYIINEEFDIPAYLIERELIKMFDNLERYVLSDIIRGLYKGQYYGYDFSVISKHSLSRIYEHYMSVLYYKESEQPYLLLEARKPEEKFEKIYGSIYTPQYIAKFFAEIASNLLGKFRFINATALDPACGSGIFLRNIAEKQIDLADNGIELVENFVDSMYGIDKNPNASYATGLSMSLLQYSISGIFPSTLNIKTAESLSYLKANSIVEQYDIVVANPPYISVEKQDFSIKESVLDTLGELARGRVDTYLGFLKASVDALSHGGVGMFVIPQSFMNNSSGKLIRQYINKHCTVRYLCDLSEIDVFPGTGAYIILLILQKGKFDVPAIAMRAMASVGEALEDVINNSISSNPAYSIFPISQKIFQASNWIISRIPSTSKNFEYTKSRVQDFFDVRQGFISGNDDVFIQRKSAIPETERAVWTNYLSDREIGTYSLPEETEGLFFMPYVNGVKVSNFSEIEASYPTTAKILRGSEKELRGRSYLQKYNKQWWEPTWPRTPSTMLLPKIVTPQVVIYPRFSVDLTGNYATSHSPFIVPKLDNGDDDMILLLLPILNSTAFFWWITNNSPKYRGGYYRLSGKVILDAPIPNLTLIPQNTKRKIINMTKRLLDSSDPSIQLSIQQNLDDEVFKLYGMSKSEFIDGTT